MHILIGQKYAESYIIAPVNKFTLVASTNSRYKYIIYLRCIPLQDCVALYLVILLQKWGTDSRMT